MKEYKNDSLKDHTIFLKLINNSLEIDDNQKFKREIYQSDNDNSIICRSVRNSL